MRTTRTRGLRGAPPRRRRTPRRPTRIPGRPRVRRSTSRRSGPTGHRHGTHQLSLSKVLTAAVLIAVLGVGAYLLGAFKSISETNAVSLQLVYSALTTNESGVALPATVKNDLLQIGLAHQRIALTRVDSTGEVTTTVIDLTPRTGDSPKDPVLKVTDRAVPAIDAKIAGIEKTINSSPATTGNRALYTGLTKIDFTNVPVTIISSGIDLANPDNFRDLNWTVPAQDVLANVKKAGALAALHGPVTFVVVPTAGSQPQLSQAQKNYRQTVWTSVLIGSGATSVTFIDADGTVASSSTPAPAVPVPGMPGTPIQPVGNRANPKTATCTVPATYFFVNTPKLIDPLKTKQDLTTCVKDALAAGATFTLDGWTSYEGTLTSAGKPAIDDPGNRKLSDARVQAIADLLVNDLGVPRSKITHLTGHGNVDQPNPDPRSAENRVVVISYITK
jgi:hypothetical protein